MEVRFTESAHKDYLYFQKTDPKKIERIKKLCADIRKHPTKGIGKPEPLKFDLQGCWPVGRSLGKGRSRRIDRTHRLVYTMDDKGILVISCRYHY